MPTFRRFALAAALFTGLAAATVATAAQPLEPYRFEAADGTVVDAERGWVEVPEDRADPASRRIRLRYVRFPTTAANPGTPIVYLAGGPGGSGVDAARGARFPIFMALRGVADVIALDQRGTGESNTVPVCPASRALTQFTGAEVASFYRSEFARCWAWWRSQAVAIEGYDTDQNAADLEDLRRALGARRISLWGISYGTHLGLAALRRQPRSIDRVAFASLEGLEQTVRLPSTYDAYLARVAALVAADPAAREAFPDLLGTMRRVHARMDAAPVEVSVTPRPGSPPVTVRLGALAPQLAVGGMIADPASVGQIPLLYAALDAGLYEPLAQIVGPRLIGQTSELRGMSEATDLASGVSPARLAQVRTEARTALLADVGTFPMPQLAGAVSGADLGEAFRAPFRVRAPALIVMGTLDGRTPIEEQRTWSSRFDRATVVTVVNAGHNVWEAHPEVARRLVDFFAGRTPSDSPIVLPPPRFATQP